jgi:predicted secreted protein
METAYARETSLHYAKMGKYPPLFLLLCIAILSSGCSGMQSTINLDGNPTTGYSWVCAISPEGVVREVSNEYIPNQNAQKLVGAGGKFVFTFEAIAEGEAELVFSYLRVWEKDIPPLETVIYKAIVDEKKNLTLLQHDPNVDSKAKHGMP